MKLTHVFLSIILFTLIILTFSESTQAASANPQVIQVDANTTLGPSSKIANYLGIQGVPGRFDETNPDPWGVQAWRELDLNTAEICLFGGISVARNQKGKLDLEFSAFDAQIEYLTKTLGAKQINLSISFMPKDLSSNPDHENNWMFAPKDYKEWEDVVYRSVLHIKAIGLAGAHYQTWGEPEGFASFLGKPGRTHDDIKLLDDYMDLYASSYRGVKRADPAAKVGGPMTGTYSTEISRSFGGHLWGMDDFIQRIAQYNRTHPTEKIGLDEVIWQDYDWFNDARIADGVKHIQSVLKANGFPPNTPQILEGWNTDFNPDGKKSLPHHASYIVSILVEQLNLGDQGLDRTYLWPFDHDYQCPKMALVELPHPEETFGGEEGTIEGSFYGNRKTQPAVTEYCKRPAYAGLQMLVAMKGGKFIKTTPNQLSKGVHVTATRNNNQVIFLAVNNSNSTHEMDILFSNLPFSSRPIITTLKRIDENHSADCKGLEEGEQSSVEVKGGKLSFPLHMPIYSIAQLIFTEK